MHQASRRAILKTIGLIGLSSAAIARPAGLITASAQEGPTTTYRRWNGEPLARITGAYQPARAEPTTEAEIVREMRLNDVVRVRRLVRGQAVYNNNDLWLETKHGYLYASLVQPIRYHLPAKPVADLGEGRWAELIVPYSEAFRNPDPFDADASKGMVFYGCVFRVVELVGGTDGQSWYKIQEMYQTIYLRATHLRLIPDEDLSPITPEIAQEDKRLEIALVEQTITAFEYNQPVWTHPISSGIFEEDTPVGEHRVFDKRISDRMVATLASDEPGFYNLPGVPFICYFTLKWVGLHGCYWHNDYGRPRSHGCVNLPSEAARWLWRWTTPYPPLDALYYQPGTSYGTRITIAKWAAELPSARGW